MRIALLLAGEMRTFDHPSVMKKLQDGLLSKHDCHIFISTWNRRGYSHGHGSGAPNATSEQEITEDLLRRVYQHFLKGFNIEEESLWAETLDDFRKEVYTSGFVWQGLNIKGTSIPQLYKIYDAHRLMKTFPSTYDLVIRSRPDNLFQGLRDDFLDPKRLYAINCPGAWYPKRVYDVFFYSGPEVMEVVCQAYHHCEEIIKDDFDNGLHPRDACRMLYVWAHVLNGIPVVDLPYQATVIQR
jgi:hypothetical protein